MILSWTALTHLIFCIRSSLGQMYQCKAQNRGALLSLPHKGHRKDVIPLNVFEDYIRDNVDKWFRWSKKMKLPVKHMEDLILVTGCTLVTSWAAAAFDGHMSVDSDATTISLEARKIRGGRTQFFWRNIYGSVEYHNSRFGPVRSPGCLLDINLSFVVLGCSRTSTSEPMHLHQGFSCKAHSLPDYTNASCSRTPS